MAFLRRRARCSSLDYNKNTHSTDSHLKQQVHGILTSQGPVLLSRLQQKHTQYTLTSQTAGSWRSYVAGPGAPLSTTIETHTLQTHISNSRFMAFLRRRAQCSSLDYNRNTHSTDSHLKQQVHGILTAQGPVLLSRLQ